MKDYKQPQSKAKAKTKSGGAIRAGTQSVVPSWAWMFIGILIGLLIALIAFLVWQPQINKIVEVDVPKKFNEVKEKTEPRVKAIEKEVNKALDKEYQFYDILPELEVIVPGLNDKNSKEPEKKARYIVQAGSFRRMEDADRQKATLALLGLKSNIQKVIVDNNKTWYRVRIGPIDDWSELQRTKNMLWKKNLEPLVIKLKEDK